MTWRRLFAWTVGVVLVGGSVVVALADHAARNNQERIDASASAQEMALTLHGVINNRLALTGGLAAYASSHSETVSQDDFEEFAAEIALSFERYRGPEWSDRSIRSLQLAPGGVVTYVWPPETNQAAIGLDIINDPERGAAVRRSIDQGSFVLAGPFDLVQGGSGLIGRAPIFTMSDGREVFWGFATIVLDFDEVLALAGFGQDAQDAASGETYQVALRGRDGLGAKGESFYGDVGVFASDPVDVTIGLPQGTWELAIVPADGWTPFGGHPATRLVLMAGLLFGFFVSVLCRRWLDAQRLARETSDDIAAILDSIDGPVIAADSDQLITHWNRGAAILTGRAADDVRGMPLAAAITGFRPRRGGSQLVEIGVSTLADQSPRSAETTLDLPDEPDADGSRLEFDFAVGPRRGGGLVLVGVDTTTRYDNDRMAADLAALQKLSLLKDQFVATTSHEMRTPLTSIIGLAELLADETLGDLTEMQRKAIATVERSGSHLLAVVNQILDLAEAEANGLRLSFEPVDCRTIARSIIDIVEPIAAAKSIELRAAIDGPALWIDGDPVRLGEAILNLMSNAVKFTEPGQPVGIELSESDDEVTILVWDTGVGIPPEQQHLLFQPFVRIESTMFSSGTGLGLTIADKIVKQHNGTISVDSRPGEITRFSITMPLARVLVPA